jgi:hypothetical protein
MSSFKLKIISVNKDLGKRQVEQNDYIRLRGPRNFLKDVTFELKLGTEIHQYKSPEAGTNLGIAAGEWEGRMAGHVLCIFKVAKTMHQPLELQMSVPLSSSGSLGPSPTDSVKTYCHSS